jgi:NAD-dependent SIR2 family protein deacetylase
LYDVLEPDTFTASESQRERIRLDPTAVFDKHLFLENPLPCLECKRPFILGTKENKWKATLAHRFVELLHEKTGKLTRLYTQNIDGLEGQCKKLPKESVIPVHGSMSRVACELPECKAEMDFDEFCDKIRSNIKDISGKDDTAPLTSTPIMCKSCSKFTVKPTVVLFHSPLPNIFFENIVDDLPSADLFIVMGTSLTVGPANSLVYLVPEDCLRVVVNNEPVGYRLGIDYSEDATRDYFVRGSCDGVLLDLMSKMGWTDDIEKIKHELPDSNKSLLEDHLNTK